MYTFGCFYILNVFDCNEKILRYRLSFRTISHIELEWNLVYFFKFFLRTLFGKFHWRPERKPDLSVPVLSLPPFPTFNFQVVTAAAFDSFPSSLKHVLKYMLDDDFPSHLDRVPYNGHVRIIASEAEQW